MFPEVGLEGTFVGFWIRTEADQDYHLSVSPNQTYDLTVFGDAHTIYSENGSWEITGPTVTLDITSSSPPADAHRYTLTDVFASEEDLRYYDFFEGWAVWMRGF